ncbi:MAG: nickel-responsive transcriptional regulator NikR [Lentisphaerae bacterium]|nr:nickel-responsive transcriptional regulator NikR [Lentisphaerota bacterium]
MSGAVRFSVSLGDDLLKHFDAMWKGDGHPTRSEAVQALIRQSLVMKEWQAGTDVAGSVVIVYDHHARALASELVDVQHDYQHVVVATQHAHLDHDNCLESVIVKGKASDVEQFVKRLKSLKGLKHVSLVRTTTGTDV